jgi:hypothetical protein
VQARVPKCDIRPSSERRHGSHVLEPGFEGTLGDAAPLTFGDGSEPPGPVVVQLDLKGN